MATEHTKPGTAAEEIAAILEQAMSNERAHERRREVLATDARSTEELLAGFSEFDALIETITARFGELEAAALVEAEAAARATQATEVAVDDLIEISIDDDELGSASQVDVGKDQGIVQAPARERPRKVRKVERGDPLQHATGLLYEDVLWLLNINDGEGALISLERLLVLSGDVGGDVKEFIELNETKLLTLYERFLGSFTKVPKLNEVAADHDMPTVYRQREKIAKIMSLINGKATIKKVMKKSPLSNLETACIINQLRRSGLLAVS